MSSVPAVPAPQDANRRAETSTGAVKPSVGTVRTRKHTVLALLLVCGGGLLAAGTLSRGHDWGGDFAAYIMQAKSIVQGEPRGHVAANRFTFEESSHVIGPIAYPWGFPLLLAPLYAAFGLNMIVLKAVGVASFALFLVVLWLGFRRVHSPMWLLGLLGLFALNPSLLLLADQVMSDLPFMFLSTLGVVLIGAVLVERRQIISQFWDYVLIGAVAAMAFFVRGNGILLVAVVAFVQLVAYLKARAQEWRQKASHRPRSFVFSFFLPEERRPSWSAVVHLTPYAVFLVLVLAWEWLLPTGGASYASTLRDTPLARSCSFLGMAKLHVANCFDLPAEFLHGLPRSQVIYGASIPLVLAGVLRRLRSDYHVLLYVALTLLLYILLPYGMGFRYMLPILPFYVSFLLTGLESLADGTVGAMQRFRRLAAALPVILAILGFGWYSGKRVYRNVHSNGRIESGPFAKTSQDMFAFIAEHTEEGCRVIFFKPHVMRLMTNRHALMIDELDSNSMARISRGNYLCMYLRNDAYGQVSPFTVAPLVKDGIARTVYENSDFRVYRLDRSVGAPASSGR